MATTTARRNEYLLEKYNAGESILYCPECDEPTPPSDVVTLLNCPCGAVYISRDGEYDETDECVSCEKFHLLVVHEKACELCEHELETCELDRMYTLLEERDMEDQVDGYVEEDADTEED